jgi:hypothetical protein
MAVKAEIAGEEEWLKQLWAKTQKATFQLPFWFNILN